MYVPTHFREERLEVLHGIIEENSFATLVSTSPDGIVATHIPFLLLRSAGPFGTLRGHVARANPHWTHLAQSEASVIFLGSHAYISPSWYVSTDRVPTWNYVAVHAYGTPRLIDDDGVSVVVATWQEKQQEIEDLLDQVKKNRCARAFASWPLFR